MRRPLRQRRLPRRHHWTRNPQAPMRPFTEKIALREHDREPCMPWPWPCRKMDSPARHGGRTVARLDAPAGSARQLRSW